MMILLGQRVAGDLAVDPSLAHHQQAVAEADQLGELRGHHDDAHPVAREVAQDAVDLGLRADVDAAGRLVEEDHPRAHREHLGDRHLLLVAARKRGDRIVDAAALEAEAVAQRDGLRGLPFRVDHAPGGDLFQIERRDVGGDGEVDEDAVALAVLGEVDDATVDAVAIRADRERLAVERDRAGSSRPQPAHALDDLAAAGADQPGDPEDLAPAEGEGNVAEPAAVAQVADFQQHVGRLRFGALGRIELAEDSADHVVDDEVRGDVGHVGGDDAVPVAEDRDPIAVVEDFHHAVRDVDDRDPARGEVAHDPEQHLRLGLGQRRGRFVEDEDAAVERQRLGDLDKLLA